MKYKRVQVRWSDSHIIANGWAIVDAIGTEHIVETIGWLIQENNDTIVIAHSYSPNGFVCSPISIPKRAICDIFILRKSSSV